ncbi:MAG: hypothetical protein IKN65_07015 [Clostridia bacterium]|nr:hypothetical protein [Clostridia bacterium]
MLKLDQFLFLSEAEGVDSWVSTDVAKINASINDFIKAYHNGYDINDADIQDAILRKHGLSLNSISDRQMNYIAQQVEKRV